MKIAYHFAADNFGTCYGPSVFKLVINVLSKCRMEGLHSHVFHGDLLIRSYAFETTKKNENERKEAFSQERFERITEKFLSEQFSAATHILDINKLLFENTAVVYFDNLQEPTAQIIHEDLSNHESYIGCVEVNESNPSHWALYNGSLVQILLFSEKKAYGLWDGISKESKAYSEPYLSILDEYKFKTAGYQSTNLKRSIFDKFHSFERAERSQRFSKHLKDLLAYIPDSIILKLLPKCPDISERLFSILKSHSNAETNEEFSQAACSCRRLIEYVSDCLFPPTNETRDGRDLKRKNYRNRLLAFCDDSRGRNINIDVICAATTLISEQAEKLTDLANKGTHSEFIEAESKRCIIRTVLLLDDITSLIEEPLNYTNEHLDLSE